MNSSASFDSSMSQSLPDSRPKFRMVYEQLYDVDNRIQTVGELKVRCLRDVKFEDDNVDIFFKYGDNCQLTDISRQNNVQYALIGRQESDTGPAITNYNYPSDSDHYHGPAQVLNVSVKGSEIEFDIAQTSTISDMQSLLKNRGVTGDITEVCEELPDGEKSLWNNEDGDLNKQIQCLVVFDTSKLIVKTGEDICVWPKRIEFVSNLTSVCLPLCEEHTLEDIVNMLTCRGITSPISAMHNQRRNEYIYDKESKGDLSNLKKTIEHCSGIKDGDRINVILESTEDVLDFEQRVVSSEDTGAAVGAAGADDYIHFQVKTYDRTKIPYYKHHQIKQLMDTLDLTKDDEKILDVRVKSRSLFKVTGSELFESEKTLEQCGINAGDVIEVIFDDSPKVSPEYHVLLMKPEYSDILEAQVFTKNRGDDVESAKKEILKTFCLTSSCDQYDQLFEYHQFEDYHLYRPLYDSDRLPHISCSGDKQNTFFLWKNCEIFNLLERRSASYDAEMFWPWGKEQNKYWIWGIKVFNQKPSQKEVEEVFYVRLADKHFINIDTGTVEPSSFNFKTADSINITKRNRKISTFLSFLPKDIQPIISNPKEQNVLIYKRLIEEDLPEAKRNDLGFFTKCGEVWINCDQERSAKITKKLRKK